MIETFHDRHVPGRPLVLPNAWDVGSAALLVRNGFTAIGTTSLGVAVAQGRPDAVGATGPETVALAARLTRLPCMLTVDIEAGFSDDPARVAALVEELSALGVVGINIEDGRLGDELAPIASQVSLIAAVKAAAPGVFVNARTDTHWLRPQRPIAETVARATAYRDAGADGIFVPGLVEDSDIATIVALGRPVNVLAGRPLRELAALGIARVSTGSLLYRAALGAALSTALAVAADEPGPTGLPTYAEVAALTGDGLG